MFNELDVINELNNARRSPKEYAEKIRKWNNYFKGKIIDINNLNEKIVTKEGYSAFEEAANFLSKTERLEELKVSKGLSQISRLLLQTLILLPSPFENCSNFIQNTIQKVGVQEGSLNVLIDIGSSSPSQICTFLTVSDGDKKRKSRDAIFGDNSRFIGVSLGKRNDYGFMCVVVVAKKFVNADFSPDLVNLSSLKAKKVCEEEEYLPDNVKKRKITEKVIEEKGKLKNVKKSVVWMEDGSVNTETEKETIKI